MGVGHGEVCRKGCQYIRQLANELGGTVLMEVGIEFHVAGEL